MVPVALCRAVHPAFASALKAEFGARPASASIIRSASYTCGATVRCGGFKDDQFED
jgi:hypothetical protein